MIIFPFSFWQKQQQVGPITERPWLWLDANSAYVVQSGGTVSQWTDRSGNGRNFVQATMANQPSWTSSVINSLPALGATGSQWVGYPGSGFPVQMTSFYVIQNSTGSGFQGLVCDNPGGNNPGYSAYALGQGIYSSGAYFVATSVFNQFGSPGTSSQLYELSCDRGGSSPQMYAYVNGTLLSTFDDNGSGANPGISLLAGYTGYWNGYVAEVMIYNSILSGSDRMAVESYLMTKYAL